MQKNKPSEFRLIKTLEWCTELPSKNCPQRSPVFLLNDIECFFTFALDKEHVSRYYNLYAELKSELTEEEKVRLQVGFKEEEDLSLHKGEFELFRDGANIIWWILPEYIRTNLPSDYSEGNCIKFLFTFETTSVHILKKKDAGKVPPNLHSTLCLESLSQDYDKLLTDGLDNDVEIKCGDQSWKVHKSILSVRSEVLQTMINSDMVGGRTGVITLQGMDVQTVQLFLRYLYCGKLPEMTLKTAKDLYEVGDKYAVECLKKACAEFLVNKLTPKNCCETLLYANEHKDSSFKDSVIEFMIDRKIIQNGDIWHDFRKQHSMLALEVYDRFCEAQ